MNVVVICVPSELTVTVPTVTPVPDTATVAPDRNPLPLIVTANALPPLVCELGLIDGTVGAGYVTVILLVTCGAAL